MRQALTATPTALANITADTDYRIQNRSHGQSYIQVATSAPTSSSEAFLLHAEEFFTEKAPTGSNIYVWSSLGDPAGAVIYNVVP